MTTTSNQLIPRGIEISIIANIGLASLFGAAGLTLLVGQILGRVEGFPAFAILLAAALFGANAYGNIVTLSDREATATVAIN